ncbi:MAG TPA: ParB/RepB/Spo0J family partition protein [Anaerolineae bacterium]|nr:ParB/RepB/Spo0J family partition protein [Anaerolineae bacterium]
MAPRKSGLGRGLEALIPAIGEDGAAGAQGAAQGVIEAPLASISPNPHQPRAPIRDQDLVELAASIQEHGVIQPLVVNRVLDGYQLIAGERRWRAARLAGLSTVPIVVKDVAPSEMLELALVENLQRADLNALEEAMAYRQLTEEFGLTQEQVARRVGKSRVAVANTLRLLKAARGVQEALLEGRISEGHARALLGLEQAEAQEAALKTVLKRELNVRQTEELVRRLLGLRQQEPRAAQAVSPETRALEARFREALGTKVNLTRQGDRGRIVIHFYSEEELDALYERIVGSE